MTVLVDNQMPLLIELLAPYATVLPFEGRTADGASVAALRGLILEHSAGALIVRSTTVVNEALLHGTPVHFVATATAGVDNVDVKYLRLHDIVFASAPGSNANAVAEFVMLAIDIWRTDECCSLTAAHSATLGIVGYGNVGSRLAHHARAAGMHVRVYDPPLAEANKLRDVEGVEPDLRALIASADIVSLHVPLTHTGVHATTNMMNAKHVALMRHGALFVNTSRGGVVDEGILKNRLKDLEVAAVLDVYNNEPSIDTQLISLALIATPHVAGYTVEAKMNAARMVGVALLQWLGVPSAPFEHAINELRIASTVGRDLIASTNTMRHAFSDMAAVHAFDVLRNTYPLQHESLPDPLLA